MQSLRAGIRKTQRRMTDIDLFSPFRLGPLTLPNRIVMAPMTRNRAGPGDAPTALNATYYAQRAGAGLIVAEASQVSPQGLGYPHTPGIHSAEQIAGWKLVTDAVHAAGGRIFLQLWHVGRISHPSLQPGGALPVAPSAIAPAGQAWTLDGMKPYVTPRALETAEIPGIIGQYRQGAANAKAAGFDGVEVHAAHGYLLDQFLRDRTNHRTDKYGGSAENRARLIVEVMEAVGERVGWRSHRRASVADQSGLQRHFRQRPGANFLHRGARARPAWPWLSASCRARTGRSDPHPTLPRKRGRNGRGPARRGVLPPAVARRARRQQGLRPRSRQRGSAQRRAPIWSHSPRCLSPTRICPNASAAAPRSIRPNARPITAAAPRDIPTIRRLGREREGAAGHCVSVRATRKPRLKYTLRDVIKRRLPERTESGTTFQVPPRATRLSQSVPAVHAEPSCGAPV